MQAPGIEHAARVSHRSIVPQHQLITSMVTHLADCQQPYQTPRADTRLHLHLLDATPATLPSLEKTSTATTPEEARAGQQVLHLLAPLPRAS